MPFKLNWNKVAAFYRVSALLCLVFIAVTARSEAVSWGGQWRTLNSAHFEIHYPAEFKAQAKRALNLAEQVHQELIPFFGHIPNKPTQLVLVDDYDFSNGWATPVPFNQIRLFLHAPNAVDGLEQMDDWLHGLIRHEYAHILQLDMARGAPKQGRKVLGRFPLFFPHMFTPPMLIEGLAVYLETNHRLGYGRLLSSSYAMQMRAEIQSHGGDSLNQVVASQRDWPVGKHYLYGAFFWQFIAEHYGDAKIQQYLYEYSGELLPYIMQNRRAKRVFGKSFKQLWVDYLDWLQQKFAATESPSNNALLLSMITNSQQVTATKASGANSGLWQVSHNGEDRPRLQRWSLDEPLALRSSKLTNVKGVTSLDVSEQGDALLSRTISHKTGRVLNDLFVWNQQTGWQRLTVQQRFSYARWRNDGAIIALRQQGGISELWQLDRQGEGLPLWQGGERTIASFAVHPSGRFLIASTKGQQQGWNLEQFDFATKQWQPITTTKAIEHQPEFMADGRLLFSADYDGIFNIYRIDLSKPNELEQLTHITTGAFQPRWFNNQLIYQQYTSEGFQLEVLADVTATRLEGEDYLGQYNYPAHNDQTFIGEERKYRPWPTLLPTSWLPYWVGDEDATFLGVQINGTDALNRHAYEISIGYSPEFSLTEGWLNYQYDNRYQLMFLRDHQFIYPQQSNLPAVMARNKTIAARHHLLNAFEDQIQLHLGLSHEEYRLAHLSKDLIFAGTSPTETLAGAAITFNNQQYYRNVPGIGWGSDFVLVYESFNLFANKDAWGNSLTGYRLQTKAQHVFDLPGRSTLELAALGGYSNQQHSPYVLGGSSIKDDDLLFSRAEFSLPGYRAGTQFGDTFYKASVAYEAWLARIEKNWDLWPLGVGDISTKLWLANAAAWWQGSAEHSATALGIELKTEFILGYQIPVPVILGMAQGLDKEEGKTQAYLRLGLVF